MLFSRKKNYQLEQLEQEENTFVFSIQKCIGKQVKVFGVGQVSKGNMVLFVMLTVYYDSYFP